MELFSSDLVWLFIAYISGTVAGLYINFKRTVSLVTESTIDSLIEQGYLKTKGYGQNMEILKHNEWQND